MPAYQALSNGRCSQGSLSGAVLISFERRFVRFHIRSIFLGWTLAAVLFECEVIEEREVLLVESLEEGGHEVLWSIRIPGGSLRRLGEDLAWGDAAFSPDGRSVIYSTQGGD